MEIWSLDLRAKIIHSREMEVFFSAGVFQKTCWKPRDLFSELKGNGGYLGIGWEFPFEILGWLLRLLKDKLEWKIIYSLRPPVRL